MTVEAMASMAVKVLTVHAEGNDALARQSAESTETILAALRDSNAAVVAALRAPKRIVRDAQGRPVGIKPGD